MYVRDVPDGDGDKKGAVVARATASNSTSFQTSHCFLVILNPVVLMPMAKASTTRLAGLLRPGTGINFATLEKAQGQ
jgi:hypothetical protein